MSDSQPDAKKGQRGRNTRGMMPWPFGLLLLLLIAAPFPFGSYYQWSWAGLTIAAGLLLLAWSLKSAINSSYYLPGSLRIAGALFLACAGWIAVQASGWTPETWQPPSWRQAAEVLNTDPDGSVSLDSYTSTSELLKLLTYGGIFWLAVQYGRDRNIARRCLWVLAIAGALYAAYGLVVALSGSEKILWFEKTAYVGNVTSTYVNRNMYAFYAGLGLLSTVALLADHVLSARADTLRDTAVRLLKQASNPVALLSLMAMTLLIAIGFTESRGGAIASAVAMAVLVVSLLMRHGSLGLRSLATLAIVCLAVALLVYAVTGAHLGGRFETEILDPGKRVDGYIMTLEAIRARPWTGYGAGTFQDMFYLWNDGAFWLKFNYSHNLYLGAAVDLGLPAVAALFGAVALITFSCVRGVRRRRRDQAIPALGVAATALVAVHGLIDAPLIVPANAATYSFLLGLAYAQSWPSPSRNSAANRSPRAPPG